MNRSEILLIDLSAIAHPAWHRLTNDPDPNATSNFIVQRVRSLAAHHPHAAVCCDSGRSFRHTVSESYKAHRPEREAALHDQIDRAVDKLREDGFPIWAAKGFEADDVIAAAVARALALPEMQVLIACSDKDLLQLVSDRVRVKHVDRDGPIVGPEEVFAKYGIAPNQIGDWLTIVGDAADNIKGVPGIGEKGAREILVNYQSLDNLYAVLDAGGEVASITPAKRAALEKFRADWPTVRTLVTLRTDVELPFEEIAAERTPAQPSTLFSGPSFGEDVPSMSDVEPIQLSVVAANGEPPDQPVAPVTQAVTQPPTPDAVTVKPQTLAVRPQEPEVMTGPFDRQLEPRNISEVKMMAKYMHDSRLFLGVYGNPEAVFTTLVAGRELGLTAMASLRAIHIVEGKPTLAADLIRALVLRSGYAKYFRCTERTAERATFETQRGDDPPISLTYTLEEAKIAGVVKPGSAWIKSPADMCVARASSKLARLVFSDVVHGLLASEELGD